MRYKTIILLILILILAGFFRFWRLKTTPPGLHYDENWNKINALQTLESGEYKVFYPDNFGREGLFIWLTAGSFKIFGSAPWSLRLVSAVIGLFTVLGLFLLAKELFNEKIALLSSFFLAVSFWHVNFSRIGYRAIMVPFFLCFSFYFLLRGIHKKSVLNFILAGVFFGLGFYTYISFRAAVLLLAIVVIFEMARHWQKFKNICHCEEQSDGAIPSNNSNSCCKNLWQYYRQEKLWLWDLLIIVFLIVLLPLAIHFIKTPADLFGRSSQVSVFSQPQPVKEFCVSAVKTLGMFNFYGDPNWRHNFAGQPMLNWAVGILFLIGLALSVSVIASSAKGGAKQSREHPTRLLRRFAPRNDNNRYIFLLSWFVIMLLPAIFTYEGMPHALRSIGIIPVAYIFAALGLNWLIKQIPNKKIAVAILIIFLLYPAIANYQKYFIEWANNPNVYSSFR